jgi:hypothetical protein
MVKFLIKEISTGTPNNPNFAGVKNNYYLGKGHQNHIGRMVIENDYAEDAEYFKNRAIKCLAMEYGFATERACKTAIAAEKKHRDEETERYGFHTFEFEIFPVEVA